MPIPRLRRGLDGLPSPWPDRPGILLRDAFLYSDTMLLISPIMAFALHYLDGEHSELDLQEMLTRTTGRSFPSEAVRNFVQSLQSQGFLETDEFFALRDARHAEFRKAPARNPVHTANAYPREQIGRASCRERV